MSQLIFVIMLASLNEWISTYVCFRRHLRAPGNHEIVTVTPCRLLLICLHKKTLAKYPSDAWRIRQSVAEMFEHSDPL